jgi:tRNA uridine 5-carboxymethylaminomethyl modification enzyme
MAALERLLVARKVDGERLSAAGFGELTATAGLTWAQLLKRPEVGIEAVLGAMREELEAEPLLAEWNTVTNAGPSTAQVAKDATCSAQDDSIVHSTDEGEIALKRSSMRNEARAVETEIKFAGYLEQQKKSIAKLKAAEGVAIPEWIDYGIISGLSREMREKLERVRPVTIGQASRIPGVTPAALGLVHVSIRLQGAKRRDYISF